MSIYHYYHYCGFIVDIAFFACICTYALVFSSVSGSALRVQDAIINYNLSICKSPISKDKCKLYACFNKSVSFCKKKSPLNMCICMYIQKLKHINNNDFHFKCNTSSD